MGFTHVFSLRLVECAAVSDRFMQRESGYVFRLFAQNSSEHVLSLELEFHQ